MARGIFGLKRLSKRGPLTFSESQISGTGAIEDMFTNILDKRDIDDVSELDQGELNDVVDELADNVYPDGGEEIQLGSNSVSEKRVFKDCLTSKWADVWEEGFTQSTTGDTGFFEELIIKANGCTGIADAGRFGIMILTSTER